MTAGFDLHAVATICKIQSDREKALALPHAEMIDDVHLHPYLRQTKQVEALSQTVVFQIPDVGTLEVSGFLINSFSRALQGDEQEVLSAVFSGVSIPADSQKNYAAALNHGQVLVIVCDSATEVEKAADLLATGEEIEVSVYEGACI